MPSLSSEAKQQIQSHLDGITKDSGKTGIPGVVFVAVDKEGSSLVEVASGQKGLTDSSKMDMDSVFCIFSCTKMITGIACMQLVEQGKLKLDSPEQVYEICPEIKAKKVLTPEGKLEDRKKDITLRMLLTHTAGFGYSFFNPFLRDYGRPTGWDEFSGDEKDYLLQPLVFQPGDMWQYGINIDWAGIMVERVTGLKLNEYFQQNIFEPLGLKNINMFPTQHMRENMVTMQQKYADGSFADHDHLSRRSIWHSDEPGAKDKIFNSGGAGCFAKPKEYTQIIATLLNNGTSPTTKKQILKPETVEEMFKNQIPQFPDFGRGGVPAAKPLQTNPIPDIYPQEGNPPQGWGITWMITIEPGMTGRGANTAFWAGITNLFWWADREKGVGGMIAAQTLPFADPHVLGGWVTCEKAVYDGLQA